MNNMAELITVAKYYKTWTTPHWICCVWNNEDLNQVTWEQRIMQGFPKFSATQELPNVPYHRFAELIGLKGLFCDKPDEVARAWDEALAADRPVVLEFKTDQEIPPIPPHIMKELGVKSAKAMVKGDPEAAGVIRKGATQKLHEFTESLKEALPGKKD
jgi:pyruvate dehydrogenase (quinone)